MRLDRNRCSGWVSTPSNKGLHQTGRGGAAVIARRRPVVEARPAGEARCYPGAKPNVASTAVALLLLLLPSIVIAAAPQRIVARLEGAQSVVLGEPLALSLVLAAKSKIWLATTLPPHLSVEREGAQPSALVYVEAPCADLMGTLQEVSRDKPLTLPIRIHVGTSTQANKESTGVSGVALAFPASGRYRIRGWTYVFAKSSFPKRTDPDYLERTKSLAAMGAFSVESPPFFVDVVAPPSNDLEVFERFIKPNPSVLLGGSCGNSEDLRRAETISRSFPNSRYLKLLLGGSP